MKHPIFEITMFWNEKSIFKERVLNTLEYARAFYIAEGNESHSGKIKRGSYPSPASPNGSAFALMGI